MYGKLDIGRELTEKDIKLAKKSDELMDKLVEKVNKEPFDLINEIMAKTLIKILNDEPEKTYQLLNYMIKNNHITWSNFIKVREKILEQELAK